MKKLDLIVNNVFNESNLNEDIMIIYYHVDLLTVPPFMESPFTEDCIWSDKTNDIIKYVFEIILSNYLINDIMLFGNFIYNNNEEYDFIKTLNIYKKYKTLDEDKNKIVDILEKLYYENIDKELNFKELVRLLFVLEDWCKLIGIDLFFEPFINPHHCRYSKRIKANHILRKYIESL